MTALSTQEIAERVGGELSGRADLPITGVEQLDRAAPGQISFVRDAKFAADWLNSKASAALVSRDIEMTPDPRGSERAVIHVANADQAMSVVLGLFATPQPGPPPGVHPTGIVDATAQLGDAVAVGPHTVIGANCRIGDRCVIHGGVNIYNDCVIGSDTVLWPGVVIREQTEIGSACILHPNVVIGADGFGYHRDPAGGGLVKIPHIGNVHIGEQVEIGAGTCVDRGKFSSTSIGDGTKIDNLCQIAHNCRIGRGCILAGQVGLAGSVTLGDGVVLGGKVAVRDQVTIGDGAQIAGVAAVVDDVPAGATWAGYPAQDKRAALRGYTALRKLPDIIKAFKKDRKQ